MVLAKQPFSSPLTVLTAAALMASLPGLYILLESCSEGKFSAGPLSSQGASSQKACPSAVLEGGILVPPDSPAVSQ